MPINRLTDPRINILKLRWRRLPGRVRWRIYLIARREVARHRLRTFLGRLANEK